MSGRLWRGWRFLPLALLLLALVYLAFAAQPATRPADDGRIVFVQITDTHIGRVPENAQRTGEIIRLINALTLPVDFVIHTGDILDDGHYENNLAAEAKALLAGLRFPLYQLAGNNDIEAAAHADGQRQWEENFGELGGDFLCKGVRFIYLCTEDLRCGFSFAGFNSAEFLRERVTLARERDEGYFVFMHAAPVEDFYNNAPHDTYPAAALATLRGILAQYPPVALIAGHFHRAEAHDIDGLYRAYVSEPIDNRWGRQAVFRIYTYDTRTRSLSYTTQYLGK